MKPLQFEGNDQYMRYEYHRVREGPNYFVCYYKNSATMTDDPKDAWRTLGCAKFTDTGKALKQWCLDMYEQYSAVKEESRADTSFASEVQLEEPSDNEALENPVANTRMVT